MTDVILMKTPQAHTTIFFCLRFISTRNPSKLIFDHPAKNILPCIPQHSPFTISLSLIWNSIHFARCRVTFDTKFGSGKILIFVPDTIRLFRSFWRVYQNCSNLFLVEFILIGSIMFLMGFCVSLGADSFESG